MAVSSTVVAIGDTVLASDYNELRTDVVHTSTGHVHDASDSAEIDGDHLDIDFSPSNYTPDSTPTEAADTDDLAAHLKGLDTMAHGHPNSQGSGNTSVSNSTTFVNVAGMAVAVAANKQYFVAAFISFESNADADIKFQLTHPSGAEDIGSNVKKDATDTLVHDHSTTGSGYDWIVSGATSPDSVTLIFLVTIAGTAGSLQLQMAQQTADASITTRVRDDGSFLVAIPLEDE